MALSYRQRRKWSILILVIGLPLYILFVWGLIGMLPRMNVVLEMLIYAVLGVAWALPFKSVFKGVGKADPDADREQ